MEPSSGQLEKAVCKSVLHRGDAKVMDGNADVTVHTRKCDTWITSVIENKVSAMKWSHDCNVHNIFHLLSYSSFA